MINRKLEHSLGLERLSSAQSGFLIDELGQEPQSYKHWQTSTSVLASVFPLSG